MAKGDPSSGGNQFSGVKAIQFHPPGQENNGQADMSQMNNSNNGWQAPAIRGPMRPSDNVGNGMVMPMPSFGGEMGRVINPYFGSQTTISGDAQGGNMMPANQPPMPAVGPSDPMELIRRIMMSRFA